MNIEMVELSRHKSFVVHIDQFHLVYGVDERLYDTPQWHVATYSDLEDGFDGDFSWYTESGIRITKVTHVSLNPLPKNI